MAIGQMTQIYNSNPQWTDLYNPNPPLLAPNLDPGNYTAAFINEASFRAYGSRAVVIEFAMDAVVGTPRFLHWYLAFNVHGTPTTPATTVPEVLERVDNGFYLNEVQAGLTRFRRVDLSGANAVVRVAVNLPAWIDRTDGVMIATRREFGWAGANPDVAAISVALSTEPIDQTDIQSIYSVQKGTTLGMGITGTVVDANHNALDVNVAAGVVLNADIQGQVESQPGPNPSSIRGALGDLALLEDPDHALRTRARVLTDEGSFGDDFTGANIATALTGTSLFTAGSAAVVGTGSLYTTEVRQGQYVILFADFDPTLPLRWGQVRSVEDNTHLTLEAAYGGPGGATGASRVSNWVPWQDGVTGSTAVANSVCALGPGLDAAGFSELFRRVAVAGRKGTAPLTFGWYGAIDNRRANQNAYVGFFSQYNGGLDIAFRFTGVVNTIVACRSQGNIGAFDLWTEDVTLPAGGVTSGYHFYQVRLYPDRVDFFIDPQTNRTPVASHPWHVPDPYQEWYQIIRIANAGVPAGATMLNTDQAVLTNNDDVRVIVEQMDASKLHMTPARVSYAAETSVAAANANTALLAANAARVGFEILNDSDRDMRIAFGGAAAATSVTLVPAGASYYDTYRYTGVVNGFWLAGVTGNARVRELT